MEIKIIEADKIPKEIKVGNLYSVSWSDNPHMVWMLINILNKDEVELQTLKTKNKIVTVVSCLRNTHKVTMVNATKRINDGASYFIPIIENEGLTKVVHSSTKTAWNLLGTQLGMKYKIAVFYYFVCEDEYINSRNRLEAKSHAEFCRDCFNKK